jgi:hypothetical protein
MSKIKVTNNSVRLYTNVGGQNLIPGKTVEIDANFKNDLLVNGEPLEGLEIADVEEKPKKAEGWKAGQA